MLIKKRIRFFLILIIPILLVELIALSLTWVFVARSTVQTLGLILIVIHLFVAVTYYVVFDVGPANRLKKTKFKQNNLSLTDGHTYYYALKGSAWLRLLINIIVLIILIGFSLATFI